MDIYDIFYPEVWACDCYEFHIHSFTESECSVCGRTSYCGGFVPAAALLSDLVDRHYDILADQEQTVNDAKALCQEITMYITYMLGDHISEYELRGGKFYPVGSTKVPMKVPMNEIHMEPRIVNY